METSELRKGILIFIVAIFQNVSERISTLNVFDFTQPRVAKFFLKKNRLNLFHTSAQYLGEVNETISTFEAENMNQNFMTLFPDAGNPIEIRYVNFFLQVTHGEMDTVNLAIKGDVKLVFNGNTVIYKGKVYDYSYSVEYVRKRKICLVCVFQVPFLVLMTKI